MAEPRDYTDAPRRKDVRAMLTPVAFGAGVSVLLLLIYSVVR
ncbi:MAG TPA: hypothetical protein VHG30_15960 [Microvirga sp.]|jgi:hypothetical protein|nr:hypothetical protein [Microvirga sp.]